MTKPIASTAIMLLIEEGKLTLDTKLSEFYPDRKYVCCSRRKF